MAKAFPWDDPGPDHNPGSDHDPGSGRGSDQGSDPAAGPAPGPAQGRDPGMPGGPTGAQGPQADWVGTDETDPGPGSGPVLPKGIRNRIPTPASIRATLLSWGPAALAPALVAFATIPEQLTWTGQISSRLSSLASPVYDEVTGLDGYGEALEIALLDLRGGPARILDVGTGTGFAARRLKKQYPRADVLGLDLSQHMVAAARRHAAAEKLDVSFEVGDASHLEHEDGSFDLVVCLNAPPYCDEMLRVLRPRGKALIVYSFGGPWVELAWKSLAGRLEKAGASHARGRRAGFGYYGLARKRG